MFNKRTLEPSDVFVPGKFPIRENNAFADRGNPQRDLQTALRRGFVPLIFGSYGVGKSSLAMYCAKQITNANLIHIESVYGLSLSNIFERVLEHLGYEILTERGSSSKGSVAINIEAGSDANIFTMIKARLVGGLSGSGERSQNRVYELAVKSPSDARIIDLCEEKNVTLVIDELHRATPKLSEDLSAFIKAVANRNGENFRICLLGTENDASRLVISDPGIDRSLQEIQLDPITEEEARNIIVPGMNKLGLSVPDNILEKAIRSSVGSPFIVQYLCLEMAEKAREQDADVLSEDIYKEALQSYVSRQAQRQIRIYRAAIETVGNKRYRKQILHAMAKSDNEYVTMEFLVQQVSRQLGEEISSNALSGPLRDLKNERHGQILRDVDSPSGSGRILNYSGFSDPAMKSIVRLVESVEVDELLEQD